jgi:hypothetical protein
MRPPMPRRPSCAFKPLGARCSALSIPGPARGRNADATEADALHVSGQAENLLGQRPGAV